MHYRFLLCAISCLVIASCGEGASVKDGETIKCGAGQKQQFNADTGKPICVNEADGAGLSDADATGQSTGNDSTIGKDQVNGGKDGVDGGGTDEKDVPSFLDVCPQVSKDKGSAKIGQTCTQASDCATGQCVFGGPLTGYDNSIGYCSRVCGCPNGCDSDNIGGVGFGCSIEKTNRTNPKRDGTNPPSKYCARTCKNDSECMAWNPAMPDCIKNSTLYISLGSGCGKNPLK